MLNTATKLNKCFIINICAIYRPPRSFLVLYLVDRFILCFSSLHFFGLFFFIFNGLVLIRLCFLFICFSHCLLPVFISLFYSQSGSMNKQTQLSELHSIELKPDKRHFWLLCHCCARLKDKPPRPPLHLLSPGIAFNTCVYVQTNARSSRSSAVSSLLGFFLFRSRVHASVHAWTHALSHRSTRMRS